jgi:ComEC/Rec2-related protein
MIPRRGTPALAAFAAVLASILLRSYSAVAAIVFAVCAAAIAGAAAVAFLLAKNKNKKGLYLAAAGFGFLLGTTLLLWMDRDDRSVSLAVPATDVSGFTCVLSSDSLLSRDSQTILRVTVKGVESGNIGVKGGANAGAVVILQGDYRFSLGEVLRIRSGLRPLEGGGRESLISFADAAAVSRQGFSSAAWRIRADLRSGMRKAIEEAGYPASALLEALVMGSREDVPEDLSRGFEMTGSLHILALSGLHAAVIYAAAAALLGFFRNRFVTYGVATAGLLFYQFLAGPLPSLVRATLMIAIGGAAALRDRDREPLNLLSVSGILILMADPYQAFSLSFQLSFLSILGILTVAPQISRALAGRVPLVILGPFAASAAAQAATFPVVCLAFGAYYPSGLLAGLVLIPLTTVFLWMGLAWLAVFPIAGGIIGPAAAAVFGAMYRCIEGSASLFAGLPGIAFSKAAAPAAALVSAAVLAAVCFMPRRARA